ncbi:molybdopterin-dependent oxidoreductase [Ampullimonas aquatilis]|uniref:nitrate reductase n=1 Tax=Ampullimonas aquatilis TaxID=1341549 RepID=UPI003C73040F
MNQVNPGGNPVVKETRSTCCYCGVGCGVLIQTEELAGQPVITGVRGDPDHPANYGRLCTKGSTLHLSAKPGMAEQVRAAWPMMRQSRDAVLEPSDWASTLDILAEKFEQTIRDHGPDSIAFYISGQLLTEDYYVFNKLAKGLIGTNNVDTNSRLCMSSAVAGYKQTLGADAPPACYEDFDHAEVIFIVGSNTAFAHPIIYRRIEAARKANPAMKIIVADPRRTDTAREADLFLPILPGTDVALFNGMLHLLMWDDAIDEPFIAAHTEGFAELKQIVRDYTPRFVAEVCGIAEEDLVQAANWFGRSKASLSLYCQGLNQSAQGTTKNAALINLHLATGQIGKPGAGPFSLTGQPNAMGGREVGGLANLLSAHRDMANSAHRAEVAQLWQIADVPATQGKSAVEMFDAVAEGKIKIIWIACTNPAQSMPDIALVRKALETAELVIVQEAYSNTATVAYADVVLPATSWGEKDGSVTNSERCITRVRPAVPGPGVARHDWQIAVDFAQRLEARFEQYGYPTGTAKKLTKQSLFDYPTAESIWNEHRESTRGRDLDITGLSYAILGEQGPQQWPMPEGSQRGKQRLYEDGVFPTATGKAKFFPAKYLPVAEKVDARYPVALTTGRLRDQWHGMSRTGTVAQLFAHAPEPCVQMNPLDVQRRMLQAGDLVHVTSRRGSQILPIQPSDEVRMGQAFIAMHWGDEFVSGQGHQGQGSYGVNVLTNPAFDAYSKQPELKHAAIKILKAELPQRVLVFAYVDSAQALRMQTELRPLMKRFAFASCVLFGRERTGILFRAASYADDEFNTSLQEIFTRFGLTSSDTISYQDKKRGHARRILVRDDKLEAVALVGDLKAEGWLKSYLEEGLSVAALRRFLLMPSSQPPQGFKARGKIVCTCFNVAETEINEVLATCTGSAEVRLAGLQGKLKCGTNCGSCVPELKRLVMLTQQAA